MNQAASQPRTRKQQAMLLQQQAEPKRRTRMSGDEEAPRPNKKVKISDEKMNEPQRLLQHIQRQVGSNGKISIRKLRSQNVVEKGKLNEYIRSLTQACLIGVAQQSIFIMSPIEVQARKKLLQDDDLSVIDPNEEPFLINSTASFNNFCWENTRNVKIEKPLKRNQYIQLFEKQPVMKSISITFDIRDSKLDSKSLESFLDILADENIKAGKILQYKFILEARRRQLDTHLEDILYNSTRFKSLRVFDVKIQSFTLLPSNEDLIKDFLLDMPNEFPKLNEFKLQAETSLPLFLQVVDLMEQRERSSKIRDYPIAIVQIQFGQYSNFTRVKIQDNTKNWTAQFTYHLFISFENKYQNIKSHDKNFQNYIKYLKHRAPFMKAFGYKSIYRSQHSNYGIESTEILRIVSLANQLEQLNLKLNCNFKKLSDCYPLFSKHLFLKKVEIKFKYQSPSFKFTTQIEDTFAFLLQKHILNLTHLQNSGQLDYQIMFKPYDLHDLIYTGKQYFAFRKEQRHLILKQNNMSQSILKATQDLLNFVFDQLHDFALIKYFLVIPEERKYQFLGTLNKLFQGVNRTQVFHFKIKINPNKYTNKFILGFYDFLDNFCEEVKFHFSFDSKWIKQNILQTQIDKVVKLTKIKKFHLTIHPLSWVTQSKANLLQILYQILNADLQIDIDFKTDYIDFPDDMNADQFEDQVNFINNMSNKFVDLRSNFMIEKYYSTQIQTKIDEIMKSTQLPMVFAQDILKQL